MPLYPHHLIDRHYCKRCEGLQKAYEDILVGTVTTRCFRCHAVMSRGRTLIPNAPVEAKREYRA